ncbi:MAG: 30S ribosomal protein THX [Bacteroidales bacterium]|nr:30S ribosomal protein THX [Bacteroidales bacterium]
MGKGDKKSRRGKLFSGSFGVRRPRKNKVNKIEAKAVIPKEKPQKPKTENVKPAVPVAVEKPVEETKPVTPKAAKAPKKEGAAKTKKEKPAEE